MPRRTRVLVLGRDKAAARRAMEPHTAAYEFVPFADVSAQPPTEPTPALLRDADAAMHRHPFGAVLATSESTVLAAGALRSQYGLPGAGYDAALAVTNKWRMRRVLAGVGIDAPRAWLSGEFTALTETPAHDVVVKPLASQSARGVARMTAAEARRLLAGRTDLCLVEEAVDAVREYHCDGTLRGGRVEWMEPSVYDRPVLGAHGSRCSTVLRRDDPRRPVLDRAVRAVAGRIPHPDGVFHMEFLDDGDRVRFGEVGLRPGGTSIPDMLRLATGADLWAAFVASQLGLDPGGHGPRRPAPDLTGLILARSAADGRPPLPADEAARLPGVLGVGEGNLPHGQRPDDSCEFEYVAFYAGLSPDEATTLRAQVDDAVPAARGSA